GDAADGRSLDAGGLGDALGWILGAEGLQLGQPARARGEGRFVNLSAGEDLLEEGQEEARVAARADEDVLVGPGRRLVAAGVRAGSARPARGCPAGGRARRRAT